MKRPRHRNIITRLYLHLYRRPWKTIQLLILVLTFFFFFTIERGKLSLFSHYEHIWSVFEFSVNSTPSKISCFLKLNNPPKKMYVGKTLQLLNQRLFQHLNDEIALACQATEMDHSIDFKAQLEKMIRRNAKLRRQLKS